MFASWLSSSVGFLVFLTTCRFCTGQNSLEPQTKFIFYDQYNQERFVSNSRNDRLSEDATGCNPYERYAMIVHGLNESCNINWAVELRKNLIENRGGCIICMDYSAYSANYEYLVSNFRIIAEILTAKLNALKWNGFSSCTAFMFGFSFGSRLIPQAGIDYGQQQIGKIHLCEPAGPLFDVVMKNADPKLAALEAQCIHTDADNLGTRERNCNQDWLMGYCGETQAGAKPPPNGDHGLCPQFYNYAFKYLFPAVEKSETCNQTRDARDAIKWPRNFRMGYFQQSVTDIEYLNEKSFYAQTTSDPPFTPYTTPINSYPQKFHSN